jgi:hypothetical protein
VPGALWQRTRIEELRVVVILSDANPSKPLRMLVAPAASHTFTPAGSAIIGAPDALARQLERWPTFRRVDGPDPEAGYFVNHCDRCGTQ